MKGKPITDQEWETILQTLAPYLQRGLPVYKACIEAKIPYSTVYKRMREDEGSMQRIEALKNFKQVAYSDFILRRFLEIYNKSNSGQPISKEDMKFIYWMGEHDKSLSEMFGKTAEITEIVLKQSKNIKSLVEMLDAIKQEADLEEY